MPVGFGNQEELIYFQENYHNFIEEYSNLQNIFGEFFTRKISKEQPDADRVIFNLGLLSCEEFNEIALLCSNGYGIAAQKILRGNYEKGVTMSYLHKYPEEAKDFIDYTFIHFQKFIKHSNLDIKDEGDELKQDLDYMDENYQKIKDKFTTTLCKKCETKRPMISWTKYDIKTLAEKSESLFLPYYHAGYFRPTLQTHTTMPSIYSRMHIDEQTDALFITDSKQRELAKEVLEFAHLFAIFNLYIQNQQFNLGRDEEILKRMEIVDLCWFSDKKPK